MSNKQFVNLVFDGFHPSDFTESFLKKKLSELELDAPYGSALTARIFKNTNNIYRAHVTIKSLGQDFFAVASGEKIKDLIYDIIQKIQNQIDQWRHERFKHPTGREQHALNKKLRARYAPDDFVA